MERSLNHTAPLPLSIILDFDGTMTVDDIGNLVVEKFATPGWEDAYQKLLAGELAVRDAWAIEASHLRRQNEQEMVAHALEAARIRPGLSDFMAFADEREIEVEIASSGFSFYVDAILERARLSSTPRSRPVVRWADDGSGRLSFEEGARDCASTALCKCARIWAHRRRGRQVVFVGDGMSDICAAGQADVLLARSKLAEIARARAIPFTPFEDFNDVRETIARLMDQQT